MNEIEFKKKFIDDGWNDEKLDNLPDYSLYKGVACIVSFLDRISVQYHPVQKYIRLIISGVHETLVNDENGFIKKAMMDDSIGIQLSYGKNLEKTIDMIIEKKDELTIKNYIMIPSMFSSVSEASILMLEQFLDKDEYLRKMDR